MTVPPPPPLPPLPRWQPAGPAARSRPVKAQITRDQIVDAALRLVVDVGIDGVSMRRLAHEFDTGPSSLYAHIASKDELLQLMFDRIWADVPVPAPDPANWREQIKAIARAGHAVMAAHHDLAQAALATIPIGPNMLRVSDGMLGIMLAGGLPAEIAALVLDRLLLYCAADAYEGSLHTANMRARGQDVAAYFGSFRDQLISYYSALPAETYPLVRTHARTLTDADGGQRFEFGLSMLVDGLAQYAKPPSPKPAPG